MMDRILSPFFCWTFKRGPIELQDLHDHCISCLDLGLAHVEVAFSEARFEDSEEHRLWSYGDKAHWTTPPTAVPDIVLFGPEEGKDSMSISASKKHWAAFGDAVELVVELKVNESLDAWRSFHKPSRSCSSSAGHSTLQPITSSTAPRHEPDVWHKQWT
ncbi:hypothetical protein Q8A67_018666 [Cirrhinus molitorella]|uniref:Uncharacterized protein n=1 Tax=Cirrhinus molitorella TaxID=172907 RepID=A0AA88THM0_9TELE|nr:hypothetical protein Q8A67_018666 [Cirrhinus molitorella]